MAKLTLDKLEKHLDSKYQYMLDELPVDEKNEFTAAVMYDKHARGLAAQVERWVDVHARLQEYAAFVTSARPPYVSEQEAATLREVLEKIEQLVEFASAQSVNALEAAKLLQEVVERAAAKRESAADARAALKERILGFAGPLLEEFAAAEKVLSALDTDDLQSCVPLSFHEAIVAAFEDDGCTSVLCGFELHSPAAVILMHLFWDDEIESFTPSEEHEEDEEDEEPEEE